MIAAILAAALADAIPAGTNDARPIPLCVAGMSVPCISVSEGITILVGGAVTGPSLQMDVAGVLVFAYPPCGTPEATKAEACVRWTVDRANPNALGYQPPIRLEAPGR